MATNKELQAEVKVLKRVNGIQNQILAHLAEVAKGQIENYPQIMTHLEEIEAIENGTEEEPAETEAEAPEGEAS